MKHVLYLLIYIGLALTMGCSKPDRSEEAARLKQELHDMLYKNPEQALVRVKSRALTFKGDCEYHLEHPDEAERYYLESTFSRNETIFSHRGTVVS